MSGRPRAAVHGVLTFLLVADAAAVGGCLAYHVVAAPVKVAATTVVVAGETTGAAVKATGRIAVSAFNAAGRAGSDSIDAASRLTEAGMVTFVDVATGTVVRVPWREGLTIAGASADARVDLARRTVEIVRSGAVVFASKRLAESGAAVASGDVVRVRG